MSLIDDKLQENSLRHSKKLPSINLREPQQKVDSSESEQDNLALGLVVNDQAEEKEEKEEMDLLQQIGKNDELLGLDQEEIDKAFDYSSHSDHDEIVVREQDGD